MWASCTLGCPQKKKIRFGENEQIAMGPAWVTTGGPSGFRVGKPTLLGLKRAKPLRFFSAWAKLQEAPSGFPVGLPIRNPHKAPNGQNCCGPHMGALCGSWLDSGYSVSVSVLVRLTHAWSTHLKRLWIDVIVNMFCDWVNALFVKKKQTEMAVISHHHQWFVHSLYGQKYWHPFFRREKGTSKLWQQRWKHD